MKVSAPKVDDLFADDVDVQIARVIQKVFMIGVLVGRNQIQDDMNTMATPLSTAVGDLMSQLGKLVPHSNDAVQLFHPMIAKSEDMAKVDFAPTFKDNLKKSEKKSRELQQKQLSPNNKRLEAQHDKIVSDMVDSMEQEKKQTIADIVNEVGRFAPKKK
jgi:hypothetical protein